MKALFFGPPSTQLLGVYHAPTPGRERFLGAVLCYPFGQEYMRAHRAFRQLAISLAGRGFHVLRFDYRGTGDSAGDLDGITARDWLEDICCAAEELKVIAGVPRVALVGLRLGALLAGIAATQRRDLEALVLWDPVINGEHFRAQVYEAIHDASPGRRRANFVADDGSCHFNGFHLPQTFQDSLCDLNLLETRPAARRSLQVVSHDAAAFHRLAEHWQSRENFEQRCVPAEHDWNYVDYLGGILLPQAVLREISQWL